MWSNNHWNDHDQRLYLSLKLSKLFVWNWRIEKHFYMYWSSHTTIAQTKLPQERQWIKQYIALNSFLPIIGGFRSSLVVFLGKMLYINWTLFHSCCLSLLRMVPSLSTRSWKGTTSGPWDPRMILTPPSLSPVWLSQRRDTSSSILDSQLPASICR